MTWYFSEINTSGSGLQATLIIFSLAKWIHHAGEKFKEYLWDLKSTGVGTGWWTPADTGHQKALGNKRYQGAGGEQQTQGTCTGYGAPLGSRYQHYQASLAGTSMQWTVGSWHHWVPVGTLLLRRSHTQWRRKVDLQEELTLLPWEGYLPELQFEAFFLPTPD